MKITEETILPFDTYSEYLGYTPETCIFFDIETTGLSPEHAMVFLIGAVYCSGEKWQLIQWIAECPEDEILILQSFFAALGNRNILIHFNGTTFDLPFLKRRAAALGICHPLDRLISLDLYRKFQPLKKLLSLERMNQTALELFLGWQREDRLTGKQMISLFKKYMGSKEPRLLQLLLLHNHDDLLGMTVLPGLCPYLMLLDGCKVFFSPQTPQENCWQILLQLQKEIPVPIRLEQKNYQLHAQKNEGVLTVKGCVQTLCHFFPDWKNYYYLPLEDQAIHKSVAVFVDKEYRRPATAGTCYIKKSGFFLPQPDAIITPVFQNSRESREFYFLYSEELAANGKLVDQYVTALLKTF